MNPAADRPRHIGRGVALGVLAVALLSVFFLFDTYPTGSWEGKLVLVPKGSRLSGVVVILREDRILRHPLAFRALVLLTFSGRRLHYGEYAFPTPPSAFEAWRRLVRGDVIKYEVTVPPGANLYDVAKLLEEKKLATAEAFLAAATSPAVLRTTGDPRGERGGVSLPRQIHLREARHAGGDHRVHGAAVPQESSPGCGKAGEGGGPFPAPGRDDRLHHREGDRGGGGEADRVGGHPETPGPRHAAPDGPDGDLRGEAIRRDGDAEGPADGGTVQHLPEPGAAPGADRQPGARGARRRPESVEGRSTFTSCRGTTGPTRSRGRFRSISARWSSSGAPSGRTRDRALTPRRPPPGPSGSRPPIPRGCTSPPARSSPGTPRNMSRTAAP